MIDFAAIDFETANNNHTSVCSIGVVIVKNGMVTDKIYELIRPAPNYYSHWATDIHGLRFGDTQYSEIFPNVWRQIVPVIEGLTLIAHNSPFDEGCLRKTHEHYGIEYPEYEFLCTYRMARKAFPELPNHQLNTVAKYIGYNLTDHHHALADAEACAKIAKSLYTLWKI